MKELRETVATTGKYTTRRRVRIVIEATINAHLPAFDQDEIGRHVKRLIGSEFRNDDIIESTDPETTITWMEIVR